MITMNAWAAALTVGLSVVLFTSVVSAQINMTAKRAVAVLTCSSQANWQYPSTDADANRYRRWTYALCMTQRDELP